MTAITAETPASEVWTRANEAARSAAGQSWSDKAATAIIQRAFDAREAAKDARIKNLNDALTIMNKQSEDLLNDWEAQRSQHLARIAELEAEVGRLREVLSDILNMWSTRTVEAARAALNGGSHDQ